MGRALMIPFEDEQEAVALANDVRYGLTGYVWTRDTSDSRTWRGTLTRA